MKRRIRLGVEPKGVVQCGLQTGHRFSFRDYFDRFLENCVVTFLFLVRLCLGCGVLFVRFRSNLGVVDRNSRSYADILN
jgi:hypothetical protein